MYKSVLIVAAAVMIMGSSAEASDATRLVTSAAKRHGVPVSFALKIARQESGIQCGNHNASGATGPLQIMPRSARALGYRGHIRRASCATQTEYGMKHLAMCYRGAKGNQRRAAACHYQGISALKRVSRAGAAYAARVVR